MTDRIDVVLNCTPIRVNIKSKPTNLMTITPIEGYNDKYGSNPQGIRKIFDDLFKFDQIRRRIDDKKLEKIVFYERELQDDSTK